MKLLTKRTSRGDTIVEVMLAILIAGVALAVAYQLSNSSLRTSTQAVQRSQALSYASSQIEMMKNCYYLQATNDCGFNSQFRTSAIANKAFCIRPDVQPPAPDFTASDCGPTASDPQFDIFTVQDIYDGPTNKGGTDTFTITVTWPNIKGHGNDKQVLYYRFPQ